MMTYYCPACRESFRAGHINASQKASEHLMEHEEDVRDLITISPKAYLTKHVRQERYWDERWADA